MLSAIFWIFVGFLIYPVVESYLEPLQKVRNWIAEVFKNLFKKDEE